MGVSSHPRTRPDFLEAEAVSRLLRIAEAVDIPVVIVHLTNAAALREVEAARKRGQKVYAETCPQYLLLDDSVYDQPRLLSWRPGTSARRPMPQGRGSEGPVDGPAPWRNSDHLHGPLLLHPGPEGRRPGGLHQNPRRPARGGDPWRADLHRRCHHPEDQPCHRCAVYSAENPAKLYGMFPRKGILQAGAATPISWCTIRWRDHVIRAADTVANVDYNPYEGFTTRGSIQQVWLRGRLAVEHGTVLAGPDGKYILRGKNCL